MTKTKKESFYKNRKEEEKKGKNIAIFSTQKPCNPAISTSHTKEKSKVHPTKQEPDQLYQQTSPEKT